MGGRGVPADASGLYLAAGRADCIVGAGQQDGDDEEGCMAAPTAPASFVSVWTTVLKLSIVGGGGRGRHR